MKKYILESFGCFVIGLVLFFTISAQDFSVINTSFALFAAVFLMTFVFRDFTGCFFNPAIAIGFAIRKKITIKTFWAYFLSEFIGFSVACLAFLLINVFSGNYLSLSESLFSFYSSDTGIGSTMVFACIIEIVLTAFLVFVYLHTDNIKTKNLLFSLIAAVACALAFMLSIPVTSGSINPAKVLSTGLFFGIANAGVYAIPNFLFIVLFEFVGSLVGVLLFNLCNKQIKRA